MKKIFYISILLFSKAFAQDSLTVQQYISQYKDIAIAEMHRTGVPAAITLAQGIHESSAGKSELVLQSNNHFGIKCKNTWIGKSVRHDDDARQECFRAYDSPIDSYKDHSDFLCVNKRYAFLFQYDPLDYESWARGLKQAGYATNPQYAPLLIKMIERYHLNDFTLLALNNSNEHTDMAVNTLSENSDQQLVRQIPNSNFNLSNTYPTGVFSINNCKTLFIEKGTSLSAVAVQYNVPLNKIIIWNDMDATIIAPNNQLLFLEEKQKKGSQQIHEVKEGEDLWQISQAEGIRLIYLLQYNQLSDSHIPAPGEKIYLQGYAPQAPKLIK